MAFQSFESFGALRDRVALSTAANLGGYEVLRVSADVPADDPAAGAYACQTTMRAWVEAQNGEPLPAAAAEHGEFSVTRGLHRSEGIRFLGPDRDIWAVRLRRPDDGRLWITEVGCEARDGATVVRVRVLADGDSVTPDFEPRVPDVLTRFADLVPLRQFGEIITPDPWLVDSQTAAERFLEVLQDSGRRRAILVLSVPEDSPDPTRPYVNPDQLARAAFGIATVTVLPANYTWNLTRRFGKHLAVYRGAMRLYLPGFSPDCDGREHRLIMGDWLRTPDGAERNRAEILRHIAKYSLRSQPAWSFDEIRELAARAAPASVPETAALEPVPEPASSEPGATSGTTLPHARGPRPPEPVAAPESMPEEASSVVVPETARTGEGPPTRTGPSPEPPSPRTGPADWLHRARRLLAGLFTPPPEASPDDPERAKLKAENGELKAQVAELRGSLAAAEEALRKSEDEKASYFSEWEQADARAREAEHQRNGADGHRSNRIEQLTRQLRNLGRVPAPNGWKDMGRWCDAEFGDRIELRPGALQGLKKAEFDDLWLAAECVAWLAGPYRNARLASSGSPPDIKSEVNSRLSDGPAGKGVQFRDWDHLPFHERRNIKRGNDRERKNCLRIYYYWDAAAEKVVIVSMPHHAQTRAS